MSATRKRTQHARQGAGARRWIARTGIAALLALAGAQTAQAQMTFIENGPGGQNKNTFREQSFTSGSNPRGYVLREVEIGFGYKPVGGSINLKLRADGNGGAGALISNLVRSSPGWAYTPVRFSVPGGAVLAPNTRYWITVNEGHTGTRLSYQVTETDDASGEPGWAIAGESRYRSAETRPWTASSDALKMALKGTIVSSDATLRGISVRASGRDHALDPAFSAGHGAYAVTVGGNDTRMTIEGQRNDAGATVEYLKDDNSPYVDASGHDRGFQIDLATGMTTVRIKTTSQDETASESYVVRVTKPPSVCAVPHFTPRREVWRKTIDVGVSSIGFGLNDPSGAEGFEYNGVQYVITEVAANTEIGGDRYLTLRTSPALPSADLSALRVHACGVTLLGEDGNASSTTPGRLQWTAQTGNRELFDWSNRATVHLAISEPENYTATGRPGLAGDARVGGTLRVTLGTMADRDGLPESEFPTGYQFDWYNDNNDRLWSAGDSTYSPPAAGIGRRVYVRVRFQDQAGNQETLRTPNSAEISGPRAGCNQHQSNSNWCGTVTVGTSSSATKLGYLDSVFGSISKTTITSGAEHGNRVREVSLASATVAVQLAQAIARGSVFKIGDSTFTVNTTSETAINGRYEWSAPSGFAWTDGDSVNVSVNLAANFLRATVDRAKLRLVYGEPLNTSSVPAPSAFEIRVNGAAGPTVTNVGVSENTVVLHLDAEVAQGDEVTVRYTVPGTDPIKDGSGLSAPAVPETVVSNGTMNSIVTRLSRLKFTHVDERVGRLNPGFHSAREDYEVNVGHEIEWLTIEYGLVDENASAAYLDGNDQPMQDTLSITGFQTRLAPGENLVKILVTAEDGETTKEYRVRVVREAFACPAPDIGTRREVWRGTVAGEGQWALTGYQELTGIGRLDTDEFRYGGETYGIKTVTQLRNAQIQFMAFGLDRQWPQRAITDWTLHVCEGTWPLDDGVFINAAMDEVQWTVTNDRRKAIDWADGAQIRLAISQPANAEGGGYPTIDGPRQAGEVLTATKGGITDPDGLPETTFPDGYDLQWLRVFAGVASEIPGATNVTYTPTAADVGHKLQVRVRFTDRSDGEEERTSPETDHGIRPAKDSCVIDRPNADWCTTLTVERWRLNGNEQAYGYHRGSGTPTDPHRGSLENPEIVHGDTTYNVRTLWARERRGTPRDSGKIDFGSTQRLEGARFNFAGSTFTMPDDDNQVHEWLSDQGVVEWSVGQRLTVSANLTPVLIGALVDGATLTLTYSEPLNTSRVPAPQAYSVTEGAGAGPAVSGVAIAGSKVTLTLARAVAPERTIRVRYAVPPSGAVQDTSGVKALGLNAKEVENPTGGAGDDALSDIRLTDEAANEIELSPAFDMETYAYVANPENVVEQITIEATPREHNARVAFFDGEGTQLTDANTTKPGFQAAIAVGGNVIEVRSTSQNLVRSRSYRLTVNRSAYVCGLPDLTGGTEIWSTTMVAKQSGNSYGYQNDFSATHGSLPVDSFDYRGRTYTITRIEREGAGDQRRLIVEMNPVFSEADAAEIRLHVCDEVRPLANAGRAPQGYHWSADTQGWDETIEWGDEDRVKLALSELGNTPPTGAPIIIGPFQVGQTLTVDKADLDDANGLPPGTFPSGYTFEWVTAWTTGDVTIPGGNDSTLVAKDSDFESPIAVRVSYTDGRGTRETVRTAPTPRISSGLEPCTPTYASMDWCTTLTIGRTGDGADEELGYRQGEAGTLEQPTMSRRNGVQIDVERIEVSGPANSDRAVRIETSAPLPDGSTIILRRIIFDVDGASETADGEQWARPREFPWREGEKVTVAANLVPAMVEGIVNANTVRLLYDEALDATSVPAAGRYVVKVDGAAGPAVTGVAIEEEVVTLTLAARVGSTNSATVTYRAPSSNRVKDVTGLRAADLTDVELRNTGDGMGEATLSALTVHEEFRSTALELTPAFASDVYSYSVRVTHPTAYVTLHPRASVSGASIEYLDETNTALEDVEEYQDGMQTNTDVGQSEIRVKVTGNGGATQTYTINVMREALECAAPDTGWRTVLLRATLNAARSGISAGYLNDEGRYGDLSETTFEYEGETRTVEYLVDQDGTGSESLWLRFDQWRVELEKLRLHVCDYALEVGEAGRAGISNLVWDRQADWPEVMEWGGGNTVEVAISVDLNSAPQGLPGIEGAPQAGTELRATLGTLEDADGLAATFPDDYTFQWAHKLWRTVEHIEGATDPTYTPDEGDVGKDLIVLVGYTDGDGKPETPVGSHPIEGVADELTSCPQGSDWESVMTLGYENERYSGHHLFGYSADAMGALAPASFSAGGGSSTVRDLVVSRGGAVGVSEILPTVRVRMDGDALPDGTRLNVGRLATLVVDEDSATQTDAEERWRLDESTGEFRLEGQEVAACFNVPPAVASVSTSAMLITLTYDQALHVTPRTDHNGVVTDPNPAPRPSAYTVTFNGVEEEILAIEVGGQDNRDVTIGLTRAITASDNVKLTYTVPSYQPIRDESGVRAHGFERLQIGELPPLVVVGETPTASFVNVPAGHDGSTPFTIEARFSVPVANSTADMQRAFIVSGGSIGAVSRIGGQADAWSIEVTPSDESNVTVEMKTNRECATVGAICTSAGAPLRTSPFANVPRTPVAADPNDPDALRAQFRRVPNAHDGQSFEIDLKFSDDVFTGAESGINRKVREALQISNGMSAGARRLASQTYDEWRIRINAVNNEDIVVRLDPESGPCTSNMATCSAPPDMRKLSHSIVARVKGPPAISIADAAVEEGPDAELAFEVTLNRAAGWVVAVTYQTRDGTATVADNDYTQTWGRLVFEPGQTAKTVLVPVNDDGHDEGEETMTVTLSKPSRAYIGDGEATGTIRNSDAMPAAWLARFGRTVGEQIVDAAKARLEAHPGARTSVTLAGYGLGAGGTSEDALEGDESWPAEQRWHSGQGRQAQNNDWRDRDWGPEPEARTITGRDLLTGSSFSMAQQSDGGIAGVWARGALTSFSGQDNDLSIDGEVSSAMFGADWSSERWSAGAMVAHSIGEGSYSGTGAGEVQSEVTGLYPYGRRALSERVSVWGVVGYAEGTLTLAPESGTQVETGMDLAMAAAGARGVVIEAREGGGPEIAAITDAMSVRTTSEAGQGAGGARLAGADTQVTRLRLGLEGTWPGLTIGTATVAPRIEVAVRNDAGDAETGTGVDVGGALAWEAPTLGIRAQIEGRGLVTHEAQGLREHGIAGSVSFDPRPQSERGFTVTVAQRIGNASSGGMDALFGHDTFAGLEQTDTSDEPQARHLDVNAGYGLGVFGGRATAGPELGFGVSETTRTYRAGWRLGTARVRNGALELNLQGTRIEYTTSDKGEPEYRIGLTLNAQW